MLSLNCKDVQHVKIYLPCNFEVNIWRKKRNNSKIGNGIYLEIAGRVDREMPPIFAIKVNLYLL
jgi:hypothetical protein